MSLPAWSVVTWSPVLMSLSEFTRNLSSFRCATVSTCGDPRADSCAGQMLLTASVDGRVVGLAFDWARTTMGAVAMVAPLSVVSNIVLVADGGVMLSDEEQALHLASAAIQSGWHRHAHTAFADVVEGLDAALCAPVV